MSAYESRTQRKVLLAPLHLVDQAIERTQQELSNPLFMFQNKNRVMAKIVRKDAFSRARQRLQELQAVREVVVFESRQS